MSLQGGIELRKPELPAEADNKQASYLRAAMDPDMLTRCEATIQEWMVQTEGLLAETEGTRKEPDDAGPDTELVFWRNRMAKFNGVAEQLKSKEARFVLGVAQTAKSQRYKHWKAVDNAITDALNEAKDNVKYLATLEKYTGAPPRAPRAAIRPRPRGAAPPARTPSEPGPLGFPLPPPGANEGDGAPNSPCRSHTACERARARRTAAAPAAPSAQMPSSTAPRSRGGQFLLVTQTKSKRFERFSGPCIDRRPRRSPLPRLPGAHHRRPPRCAPARKRAPPGRSLPPPARRHNHHPAAPEGPGSKPGRSPGPPAAPPKLAAGRRPSSIWAASGPSPRCPATDGTRARVRGSDALAAGAGRDGCA